MVRPARQPSLAPYPVPEPVEGAGFSCVFPAPEYVLAPYGRDSAAFPGLGVSLSQGFYSAPEPSPVSELVEGRCTISVPDPLTLVPELFEEDGSKPC